MNLKKEIPFYLLLFGVYLVINGPLLFAHGMFMDGLMYATISQNLSLGLGSFWEPFFTEVYLSSFYEHPPLAFGIQSVFFKLFGDSFLIERLYSLGTYLLVSFFLVKIWRLFDLKHAWLPIFFLLIVPRVWWATTNNMLENTMGVFLVIAVYFFLLSTKRNLVFLILSGFFVACGFLTKGPFALFIWVLPFLYWGIVKKESFFYSILQSLKLLAFTLLPLGILFVFSNAAYNNIYNYLVIQVVNSLEHVQTVQSRFYIVEYFLSELILSGVFVFLIFSIYYFKHKALPKLNTQYALALVFLILGLCGVLPIMISMKQSGFYSLPTYPVFALGFAFLSYAIIDQFITWICKFRLFLPSLYVFALALIAFGSVRSVMNYNTFSRDEEKIKDVWLISDYLGKNCTLEIEQEELSNWSLQAYFQRYGKINLAHNAEHLRYKLIKNDGVKILVDQGYKKVGIPTKEFHLYEKLIVEQE